jgi:hypothetical protein
MNNNIDNDASLTVASSIEATSVKATSVKATSVEHTSNKSATNELTAIELTANELTSDSSEDIAVVDPGTDTQIVQTPSAVFPETLKETDVRTFGNGNLEQTSMLIVGFDSAGYIQFCDKVSPDYNPSYCDYGEISRELFQAEEVWISCDLLLEAMELVAKYHVFTIRLDKEYIKCNRQGTDKTKRACLNGPLSAGCTFKFKLASLETERYMP